MEPAFKFGKMAISIQPFRKGKGKVKGKERGVILGAGSQI
jgi:hypothetical protein